MNTVILTDNFHSQFFAVRRPSPCRRNVDFLLSTRLRSGKCITKSFDDAFGQVSCLRTGQMGIED